MENINVSALIMLIVQFVIRRRDATMTMIVMVAPALDKAQIVDATAIQQVVNNWRNILLLAFGLHDFSINNVLLRAKKSDCLRNCV